MRNIDYNAYWVSPSGEIIPVGIKHIDAVFDNPELFGFSTLELHNIFDLHNEPYRYEGKARRKILENIINNGWIRLRRKSDSNTWTINIADIKNSNRQLIDKWINYMKENNYLYENDELIIIDTKGNRARIE